MYIHTYKVASKCFAFLLFFFFCIAGSKMEHRFLHTDQHAKSVIDTVRLGVPYTLYMQHTMWPPSFTIFCANQLE